MLYIEHGHFFQYEDTNGNFQCTLKDDFCGVDADVTRGQDISYDVGYTWRWGVGKRSEVFEKKQHAFGDAFYHLFVSCPVDERTETVEQWQDFARDNNLSDDRIIYYLTQGE